ncbi:MAG: hypothetical protein QF375_02200 [Arenicellales bacterium]|jgi:hypothetical protein|nr:hypothetical protein [Arenicellales bacterium]MDP6854288.1 hypothetical protein [Arenicellales bacterium]MDP6918406.1 hypothetical protein [Arenicellales bacterium]|tara:strand:- start:70978 stop:71700 length:723 start_codon:yes stop_codon:yes gene_type:complete
MEVLVREFNTRPCVVHGHGKHDYQYWWEPIKSAFFSTPPRIPTIPPGLTIITCNNGHPAMGMFESSLEYLGVPYRVFGQDINPWLNSRDKPTVLASALALVDTPYVLYADSRDAILIGDPAKALDRYEHQFSCDILFGADRINWPPEREFARFEEPLARQAHSEFRYLNGGLWIGRTAYCAEFFSRAATVAPVESAVESEQGILKKLFPECYPHVQLDYHCEIFLNTGFLLSHDALEILP